jgi:AraC-like DNA-binding protein
MPRRSLDQQQDGLLALATAQSGGIPPEVKRIGTSKITGKPIYEISPRPRPPARQWVTVLPRPTLRMGHAPRPACNARTRGSRRSASSRSAGGGSSGDDDPPGSAEPPSRRRPDHRHLGAEVAERELTPTQLAQLVSELGERHGFKLSKRQRDPLIDNLLDAGINISRIADRLGCAPRTVARRQAAKVGSTNGFDKRGERDKTGARDRDYWTADLELQRDRRLDWLRTGEIVR